jgi:pyridoxal phosphate enzyme (YggS family)
MLEDNVLKVKSCVAKAAIDSGRQTEDVTLIAVTKYVTANVALSLVNAGITNLAENRVDLLLEKKQALVDHPEVTWHLIGNLQRRKVKNIINEIDYFHALDGLKLASEINKRAEKVIKCFVEVNVSGEETKHGFNPADVEPFIKELAEFHNIEIVGLMTMAPHDASTTELDGIFNELKHLQQKIANLQLNYAPCTELSMGMSADYEEAIKFGSTFVRVGTAFFEGL